MVIGYDAKRAALNSREIGDYGRQTIDLVSRENTLNKIVLFTPEIKNNAYFNELINRKNISAFTPQTYIGKRFKGLWRSKMLYKDLVNNKIDLYHGLCNELPLGISETGIKSVVTIHDTEFLFPYCTRNYIDRHIIYHKSKYACLNSDRIIAISQSVKNHIMNNFYVPSEKIDVIYQDCNSLFKRKITSLETEEFIKRQNLPQKYILTTCSANKKDNVETIIYAMTNVKSRLGLIILGQESAYLNSLRKLVEKLRLKGKIFFITSIPHMCIPALYHGAEFFVYTSLFDNFGFRVLEALNCNLPVICGTSAGIQEAAGPQSIYCDAKDPDKLYRAIDLLFEDFDIRESMVIRGKEWKKKFSSKRQIYSLLKCYSKVGM